MGRRCEDLHKEGIAPINLSVYAAGFGPPRFCRLKRRSPARLYQSELKTLAAPTFS